jgi:hypothetical protein
LTPDAAELLPQPRAGMVQIRPGRPLGNTEHATDLRMLESFDVVQDDHGALPLA